MSVNSFILVFDKGSAFTEKYFGFPAREDHKYQVHLYVSGGFLGCCFVLVFFVGFFFTFWLKIFIVLLCSI